MHRMYCVYLTIYFGSELPKRYIGSTSIKNIESGYNGSIKSKKYKEIFLEQQRLHKDKFKTRILSVYASREEALVEELRLQIKYNVIKSDKYMNMSLAQVHGFFGKPTSGKNHPFYAKHHTIDVRKQISESVKLAYKEKRIISPFKNLDVTGKNNPFYGRTHSEESKNKMRKPKATVPKFKCPHCDRIYDKGNLVQHLKRNGFSIEEIQKRLLNINCVNLKQPDSQAPEHTDNIGLMSKL